MRLRSLRTAKPGPKASPNPLIYRTPPMNTNPEPTPADVEKVAGSIFEQLQTKYTDDQWQSYDKLEESEREFARELARAAIAALSSLPSEREQIVAPERFRDEIDAAAKANAWIDELAFTLAEKVKPLNAEITQEPAKAVVLWKDRRIYAAAFLVRDQMNFTHLAHLPTTEQEEG